MFFFTNLLQMKTVPQNTDVEEVCVHSVVTLLVPVLVTESVVMTDVTTRVIQIVIVLLINSAYLDSVI